jgi:hypothetical protein
MARFEFECKKEKSPKENLFWTDNSCDDRSDVVLRVGFGGE